jgi:hypothetical protein
MERKSDAPDEKGSDVAENQGDFLGKMGKRTHLYESPGYGYTGKDWRRIGP